MNPAAEVTSIGFGTVASAVSAVVIGLACGNAARENHRPFGVAGAAAFLTALRLLTFPLHGELPLVGSPVAVGFAVIVFGPAATTVATAAAVASWAIFDKVPWPGAAATMLTDAAIAPWVVRFGYRRLTAAVKSEAGALAVAFTGGAAGAVVVGLARLAAAVLGCGGGLRTSALIVSGTLAMAGAEGALACWGYITAFGWQRRGLEARAPNLTTRSALVLTCLALVVAGGAAPWASPLMTTFLKLPPAARPIAFAVRGAAEVVVAAAAAGILFLVIKRARRVASR